MVILHSDFDMKITSYPTSYAWCKYNLKFPHICFLPLLHLQGKSE